jgi:hypothetical protein
MVLIDLTGGLHQPGSDATASWDKMSVTLSVYANNAAAVTGGLAVGTFYRTGGDPDLVCVVH